MTRKLAAQLCTAEERISELEAKARYHEGPGGPPEKWLSQIEQKFFRRAIESRTAKGERAGLGSPEVPQSCKGYDHAQQARSHT
jgi:hypothetical protein